MGDKETLKLPDFICDSLSLSANVSAPTRRMYVQNIDQHKQFLKADPLEVLGEVDFHVSKKIPNDSNETPIQKFFQGLNVFITGGTGFVGKVLAEKLLRAIPNIGNVYLLIRSKKGQHYEERFNSLLEDKVFSRMKVEVPNYLSKLKPLNGNICEPSLGLSEDDQKLIQDTVHVIFHCAAELNFTSPLKHALNSNVMGTERIVNLAKTTIGLKAYVHVSTAYSQFNYRVVEEKIHKMNINYKDILNLANSAQSEEDTQKIMQGSPNTYVFSKAVCEDMIKEESKGLPICIVRPAVVTNTYKEPVRGWTDNLYGPLGFVLGVGVGVVHVNPPSAHQSMDIVPLDYLVNCIIAAAFNTGSHRNHENVIVYNFVSKKQNTICWKNLYQQFKTSYETWPSTHAIWFDSSLFVENSLLFKMCHTVIHRIPGVILDGVLVLIGQKPRFCKIYTTFGKLSGQLHLFLTRFWEFRDDNVTNLFNSLSEEDKMMFYFDMRDVNWEEYCSIIWLGLRYYYLKESMDTIPAAKRKRKLLYILHLSVKTVFIIVVLKLAKRLTKKAPLKYI